MIIIMKPLREVLASNIERLIGASAYNVREIALKMNVSETTVHRWKAEKNPIPPDVENMERLAKLLDVDPADFYKSEANIVPMYGMSSLKKYMIIPDEVVELIYKSNPDSDTWEAIKGFLDQESDGDGKKKSGTA